MTTTTSTATVTPEALQAQVAGIGQTIAGGAERRWSQRDEQLKRPEMQPAPAAEAFARAWDKETSAQRATMVEQGYAAVSNVELMADALDYSVDHRPSGGAHASWIAATVTAAQHYTPLEALRALQTATRQNDTATLAQLTPLFRSFTDYRQPFKNEPGLFDALRAAEEALVTPNQREAKRLRQWAEEARADLATLNEILGSSGRPLERLRAHLSVGSMRTLFGGRRP